MPKKIVEGKPTLFFSTNAKDKDWRIKEKFTAIIESCLQDLENHYTCSPLKIRNIVGEPEEVSLLVDFGSKIVELIADRNKVSENNILVEMDEKNTFGAISLNRIFNVDVIRNKEYSDKLFDNIPNDLNFHKA